MSQIQMQELKDWIKNPVTIQFKNFLLKRRMKLLNNFAAVYMKNEKFQNDIALSVFGSCEAISNIVNILNLQNSKDLENILKNFADLEELLKDFAGGSND